MCSNNLVIDVIGKKYSKTDAQITVQIKAGIDLEISFQNEVMSI